MILEKFDLNYDIRTNVIFEKSNKYRQYMNYLYNISIQISNFYHMIGVKEMYNLVSNIPHFLSHNGHKNETEEEHVSLLFFF